jgi:two-component system response regulator YesN
MMYKLLIVDDEEMVRGGIREYIDWERYGIEVAGEAEDGLEALEMIERAPVHIVITDVKMPHMDGIALSQRLREKHENIKIIFISGYDDLDYVKSALKLDALDYILKPLQLKELRAVVEKVVRILDEEDRQVRQRNELLIKLNQSIPLLRERYLLTLVSDQTSRTERIREKFEYLGIRLNPDRGRYCVIKVHIDDIAALRENTEKERQLTSFALLNICEDIAGAEMPANAFEVRFGEYAIILNLKSEADEEKLFGIIHECRDQLNRLLRLQVTIGVGTTVDHIGLLPESYRLASEAAERKWFLGNNQIITIDSLGRSPDDPARVALPDSRQFTALLKSSRPDEAIAFIGDWIGRVKETPHRSVEAAKNGFVHLLIACSNLLMELNIGSAEIVASERKFWAMLQGSETIDGLHEWLCSHVMLVHGAIAERRDSRTANVVAEIKAYIEKHYASDFTIADIAKSVYLTTTYICLLFKQETGLTINDYLTEVRMSKAKELLRDPRYKIYEVCTEVGYKDLSYFRKQFKKYTGYSPAEYRGTPS